jgi:hypothetical protein
MDFPTKATVCGCDESLELRAEIDRLTARSLMCAECGRGANTLRNLKCIDCVALGAEKREEPVGT